MRFFIQIPCFNEQSTLPTVLKALPKKIEGVDEIKIQVVDDSSTDRTVAVAWANGVDYVVHIPGRNRRWLGRAFRQGVQHALSLGADIVVNTDGDNQYPAESIPALIDPILQGKADIVIGDRMPSRVKEFSLTKRALQWLGNKVVGLVVGKEVRDAVSGFRAFNRRALESLRISGNYSYTIESLVQAHALGLVISWIPISPNPSLRPSRLFKNLLESVWRSAWGLLTAGAVYRPLRTAVLFAALSGGGACLALAPLAWALISSGRSGSEGLLLLAGAILFLWMMSVMLLGAVREFVLPDRRASGEGSTEPLESPVRLQTEDEGAKLVSFMDAFRSRRNRKAQRISNMTGSERRRSKVSSR